MLTPTNKPHLHGGYSILQNSRGNLAVIIETQVGEPENATLICDGSETALLYRHAESSLKMSHISAEAREKLLTAECVYIAEHQGHNVVRCYEAPVKIVSDVQAPIAP